MKLEYGAGATGASLVYDVSDCHKNWTVLQEELRDDDTHPGVGLGYGKNMLLMDYLWGTEHDVEIIMYR